MFTGIITHLGKIITCDHLENKDSLIEISLSKKTLQKKLKIGCSIACQGVCLTLVKQKIVKENIILSFYASKETCNLTTLKNIKKNQQVNIEFSLKLGDELGGHLVLGHVDQTSKITNIQAVKDSWIFTFKTADTIKKFIAPKGSITINGVSLTVNEVDNNSFKVNIIKHTFDNTTFKNLKINDLVNLEIDVIARYVLNAMINNKK